MVIQIVINWTKHGCYISRLNDRLISKWFISALESKMKIDKNRHSESDLFVDKLNGNWNQN